MRRSEFAQLDCINVPVFVLERNEAGIPCYVFVNTKSLEVANATPDQFIGKSAAQAYPGGTGDKSLERHVQCFETGKSTSYEVEVGSSNLRRAYRVSLKPQVDDHNQVIRVYATGCEITAQRDATQSSHNAEHSQMEQFVTLAAHDLRTPMRNICALTEMLREDFEDHGDGKVDLIDLIDEVATKSSTLISEVLQHSLTANAEACTSVFSMGQLCSDIAAILDPQKEHIVTWPDISLETDRMVVQVVVRNLLDNALKYGARDLLTINVSVWAEGDETLGIAVEDNGQGMNNPGIAFLDTGRVRADSGYGLLSIRRLLTARRGSIFATAGQSNIGTRVVFHLPGRILAAPVKSVARQAMSVQQLP